MSPARINSTVAAVYDRRPENEPALIESPALLERRYRVKFEEAVDIGPQNCSGGLRLVEGIDPSALLQDTSPIVAAVCDRRIKDDPGSHRQPLQKLRLRRVGRIFVDSPIYFLTACTAGRKPLLAGAEIHQSFKNFCLRSPEHSAWVGRYVLMPDHLHLFVSLDEISLSNWVKSLKNSLSKTLRALGCDSPHWQKGFFDHILRSGESYSQKWDYVRENPVRGGLVSAAEDWPYAGEIHDLEYRQ